IGQVSFEKRLCPASEIVGNFDGFGCFPDKMPPEKNTGVYIPDDFDHEIATVYNVKGRGLVVLTSCSHRGVINTVRAAMSASGIDQVLAVIGGFFLLPPPQHHTIPLPSSAPLIPNTSSAGTVPATASTILPGPSLATRSFTPR